MATFLAKVWIFFLPDFILVWLVFLKLWLILDDFSVLNKFFTELLNISFHQTLILLSKSLFLNQMYSTQLQTEFIELLKLFEKLSRIFGYTIKRAQVACLNKEFRWIYAILNQQEFLVKVLRFSPSFFCIEVESDQVSDALVHAIPEWDTISIIFINFLIEVFVDIPALLEASGQNKGKCLNALHHFKFNQHSKNWVLIDVRFIGLSLCLFLDLINVAFKPDFLKPFLHVRFSNKHYFRIYEVHKHIDQLVRKDISQFLKLFSVHSHPRLRRNQGKDEFQ